MGSGDPQALRESGSWRVDHGLLEDQMCNYTGEPGEESPDVLDALLWALTELMVEPEPRKADLL